MVHNITSGSISEETALFGVQKGRVYDILKNITSEEDFPIAEGGSAKDLGTYSVRKLPATYARQNRCSHDDVDTRGRWKSNNMIVDTYINTSIPYPDANVAAVLCIGGAIKYKIKRESGVSSNFLLLHIGEPLLRIFPRPVVVLLSTSFLQGVYDDDGLLIETQGVGRRWQFRIWQ